jgi:hypothetical protein
VFIDTVTFKQKLFCHFLIPRHPFGRNESFEALQVSSPLTSVVFFDGQSHATFGLSTIPMYNLQTYNNVVLYGTKYIRLSVNKWEFTVPGRIYHITIFAAKSF